MKKLDKHTRRVVRFHRRGERMKTIKEIRAKTGLSQAAFAKRFGIACRTVESWEGGTRKTPNWVVAMLDYLASTDYQFPSDEEDT